MDILSNDIINFLKCAIHVTSVLLEIITFLALFSTFFLWIRGIIPVLYRLGLGLAKRKIAVFALSEYDSLKSMLVDSKIFKERNIIRINKNDLHKAKKVSIFLLHWQDWKDEIKEALRIKEDATALIIYAPPNEGKIDQHYLDIINKQRNTIVVNFRGRLLNDILTSMITTIYAE